jgi:hypothetical protein
MSKFEKVVIPRRFLSGERVPEHEAKYNCRSKFIPQADGSLKLVEEMYCSRYIFNPEGVSEHNREFRQRREAWESSLLEMYGLSGHVKRENSPEDNIERSKRRAKKQMFDYIICNNFTNFCTLTLDPKEIDRRNYSAIIKKLNTYLDNRVRRQGLIYVGVPELHKNGGFHFHFLTNDVLPLIDSGTVIRPTGGKPVKVETAKRQGFELAECRTVYNISDWRLGFTTSIRTYGDPEAVANYIGKYITKGEKKVGGRWYYSGGKLLKPVYLYSRVSFGEQVGDYGFINEGGAFIVKKY